MSDLLFWTEQGVPVPAVIAGQMREVDRIAVEEFGLGILQIGAIFPGSRYWKRLETTHPRDR